MSATSPLGTRTSHLSAGLNSHTHADQRSIVAKVEELMVLNDKLETALQKGEELEAKALEGVLSSQLADERIGQLANGPRGYPETDEEVRMASEP